MEAGKVKDSKLVFSHEGPFEERPEDIGDVCGPALADSQYYVWLNSKNADCRLIIPGIADPAVRSITVAKPDGSTDSLPLTAKRGFLAVYPEAPPTDYP
jgi:hypothetical protein